MREVTLPGNAIELRRCLFHGVARRPRTHHHVESRDSPFCPERKNNEGSNHGSTACGCAGCVDAVPSRAQKLHSVSDYGFDYLVSLGQKEIVGFSQSQDGGEPKDRALFFSLHHRSALIGRHLPQVTTSA